jgi:Uma2 family endonuclease
MTTAQRQSFDDLMATPDDEWLYELVRGEILRMPPPQGPHGRIESRLVGLLDRFLRARARDLGWDDADGEDARDLLVGFAISGEAGVRFSLPDDPDQVRGMDCAYLSPDQARRYIAAGGAGYIPEVPALVAEVISPSEKAAYIEQKVADYLTGGARLVWLFFPTSRTVRVYRADSTTAVVTTDDSLSGEDVLEGFTVPVARLFPGG